MELNLNRNIIDDSYRYKMPKLKSVKEGRGNGKNTILSNLQDIANSICHPTEIILKYISFVLGSNCNLKKLSFLIVIPNLKLK